VENSTPRPIKIISAINNKITAMKKFASLLIMMQLVSGLIFAQSNTEKEVAVSIESFRKAMMAGDEATLNSLADDQLSYGHSSGLVEDKKEFLRKITSRSTVYSNIIITNQAITVSGDVAVSRNMSDIFTNDNDGKPVELKLLVLMVWQKKSGHWKLLARQAVRQPEAK
jgi:ketosteroid isomerase-like protein